MPESINRANRMKMNRFVLAGIIWTGIFVLPLKGRAQNIPQEVWEETVANLEKVTEIEVPEKILKEVEPKPGDCPGTGQEQVGLFKAQKFERKGVNLIAIRGGGACNCSPTGNCSFWVYRNFGYRGVRVLRSSMVQQFGFLRLKSRGLPDVVLWSHGSATQSTVSLWQFNGARYTKRCKWDLVFKVDSGEAQIENNTCKPMKGHEGVADEKQ